MEGENEEQNNVVGRTFRRKLRRRAEATVAKHRRLDEIRFRYEGAVQRRSSSDSENEADDEVSDGSNVSNCTLGQDEVDHDESPVADSEQVEGDNSQSGGDGSDHELGDVVDNGNVNFQSDGESSSSASSLHSDSSTQTGESDSDVDLNRENQDVVHEELPFHNDAERELYLIQSLRHWATSPGVLSMSKVDQLLPILNRLFPNVPLSHKTLLSYDPDKNIAVLDSGAEMWYNGIVKNLDRLDLNDYLVKHGKVTLDINMDGLPLFKSSKRKFWPILGHLVGTKNSPFIIAVHFGAGDPKSVDDFLNDYVEEVVQLQDNGYLHNHDNGYLHNHDVYPFEIRHYILDAPARQMVKCCKGHGGFSACEKCCVVGRTVENRRTFLDLDLPKRTDDSYRNQDDPSHHTGLSPLLRTGVGLVSQFRLDPMHLLYQGVMKKILDSWLNIVGVWKLHHQIVHMMSELSVFLKDSCPTDLNRKPRPFSDFAHFKATEFRRILLYDGMLVFKDLVHTNIYKHFLLFSCAVNILSRLDLLGSKGEEARQFLTLFIQHSAVIYGERFVVYNVHSLNHLVDECELAGILDDLSAFKYENELKSIKAALKSGFKPLQQLVNKVENKFQQLHPVVFTGDIGRIMLSLTHQIPEVVRGTQYKKISIGDVVFSLKPRDSCFLTKQGHVVCLKNIVYRRNRVLLVGCKFQQQEDFFTYPIPSSELDILSVWEMEMRRSVYTIDQLKAKCWLMPNGQKFLCVPLYVVVKFNPRSAQDLSYFEVGLSAWLVDKDAKNPGVCGMYWPPRDQQVPSMILKKVQPQGDWCLCEVQIKRSYSTYMKAREGLKGFLADSNYETDAELGRGRRKKKLRALSSSDEEPFKTTKDIPAPPAIFQRTTSNQSKAAKSKVARAEQINSSKRQALKERIIQARARVDSIAGNCSAEPSRDGPTRVVSPLPRKTATIASPEKSTCNEISQVNAIPGNSLAVASPKKSVWMVTGHGGHCGDASNMNISSEDMHHEKCKSNNIRPSVNSSDDMETHVDDPDENNNENQDFVQVSCQNESMHEEEDEYLNYSQGVVFNENVGRISHEFKERNGHNSVSSYSLKKHHSPRLQLSTCESSWTGTTSSLESVCNRVLTKSEEISSKLDLILQNQAKMIRALMPNEKKINKPLDMPALPLDTVEAFEAYEKYLEAKENFTAVVFYMTAYLVKDEKSSAYKILPKILGNALASRMSFDGKTGKIKFKDSNVHQVIEGALLTQFDTDLQEANDAVKKWLKDAPWRKRSDGTYGARQAPKDHSESKSQSTRKRATISPKKTSSVGVKGIERVKYISRHISTGPSTMSKSSSGN